MFFRFIKTFERMVLFYGRQLNGTMKETAIKSYPQCVGVA